jgi:hypothetical protein
VTWAIALQPVESDELAGNNTVDDDLKKGVKAIGRKHRRLQPAQPRS